MIYRGLGLVDNHRLFDILAQIASLRLWPLTSRREFHLLLKRLILHVLLISVGVWYLATLVVSAIQGFGLRLLIDGSSQ